METAFTYLLKSSSLLAVFYLAYHFLVRKETFFNGNRWFLLSGMITSAVLPLFTFNRIRWVAVPKPAVPDFVLPQLPTQPVSLQATAVVVEKFDWMQFLWLGYLIIAMAFVIKIAFNLISLYRILHKQHPEKQGQYIFVNSPENKAPFSFFSYIVFNASLYSEEELQSILSHEKIHSRQKHSLDVLLAELFGALFWINPFAWLYKKAITQNLEYIADQKAVGELEDKKAYQRALLKVVSNQNCFSITNNFYQSLIKKRIIMLNKNQSHRRNSWKYAMIVPVLAGFVFLFQIKVVAKNRFVTENRAFTAPIISPQIDTAPTTPAAANPDEVVYYIDKISSDRELENDARALKKEFNIDYTVSYVKRNNKGEITAIKLAFNDNKGNKGETQQNRDIPIRPIFFRISKTADGKNTIGFYDNHEAIKKPFDAVNENKIATIESIKDDALIYVDGERYDKESLNELDTKGLEKIEVLKDAKSLEKYGAKDKNEVYVITTNWSTRDPNRVAKLESPSIITLQNGDEVVVFNRCNMKIVEHPTVTFTDNSPLLIYNGVEQKNPRRTLEGIDISKIKTIKVFNEDDKEVKGTPIYKMIISTK